MLDLPDFIPTTTAGLLPCVGNSRLYDHPSTAPAARVLCARCPVQHACATWATTHQEWGTWGGLTERQRGTVHRELPDTPRLRAQPAPTCGTETARRRHITHQETCAVCDAARAERIHAQRVQQLAAEHKLCAGGSRTGYRLHRVLGIPYCTPCRAAHNSQVAAWRGGYHQIAA